MRREGRPEEIPTERRVESFADDLNTRLGIVSGRVALLPRSTEIQPKSLRFVPPPNPARLSLIQGIADEVANRLSVGRVLATPGAHVQGGAKCGQGPGTHVQGCAKCGQSSAKIG